MRNSFILLLLMGCFTSALAQKSKSAPVITRYYYFTGTIDKYPVTFHLYRNNEQFSGCYYYNSTEEPMEISGKLEKGNFLNLARHDREGTKTELLSGNFKDSSFSGTWSYKGKMLPFRVSQKPGNNDLIFDYIYTTGSKKLTGDENNRDELSYEAEAIWPSPSSNHASGNLIKEIIYNAFGAKGSQEPIGKVMISEKNEILNPGPQKEDEPVSYALNRIVKVAYRNTQLLTLSEFTFVDGGGAHGNYGTSYSNIDLKNNRILDIADVLDTLNCKGTLQTILEKKFRAAYNVPKEEKLSEWIFKDAISPNGNFMLTSKGIAFNYVPYEIAAYALGEVFLYIPFKEIGSCLKPEFKKLIGIVGQ